MNSPLAQKVNEVLKDSSLFYLSNDPERSLGLEKLLENFHHAYMDASQFTKYFSKEGLKYFCLAETIDVQEILRSSVKLVASKEFRNYYQANSKAVNYLQTFKISPAFEKTALKLSARTVNTKAELNRLFENKLSQFKELVPLGISLAESEIITLTGSGFAELSKKYGLPFVIQFNRGHTGSGTQFIENEEQFKLLQEQFPQREVKISKFVTGEAYTLNACITPKGTYMGGLSFQITGVAGLTSEKGATVGNDWKFRKYVTNQILDKIKLEVSIIGDHMFKSGYLGLFGVDLIINEKEHVIIEINARQPASIPMWSKIQLLNGQEPLSLIHLATFLGINDLPNLESYNNENLAPADYSQIFLRARDNVKVNSQINMGVYRLQSDNTAIDRFNNDALEPGTIFIDEDRDMPLIFQKEGYTIEDIEDGGMLIMAPITGTKVKSGGELARIQLKQTAIDANGKVVPWIVQAHTAFYEYQI